MLEAFLVRQGGICGAKELLAEMLLGRVVPGAVCHGRAHQPCAGRTCHGGISILQMQLGIVLGFFSFWVGNLRAVCTDPKGWQSAQGGAGCPLPWKAPAVPTSPVYKGHPASALPLPFSSLFFLHAAGRKALPFLSLPEDRACWCRAHQ